MHWFTFLYTHKGLIVITIAPCVSEVSFIKYNHSSNTVCVFYICVLMLNVNINQTQRIPMSFPPVHSHCPSGRPGVSWRENSVTKADISQRSQRPSLLLSSVTLLTCHPTVSPELIKCEDEAARTPADSKRHRQALRWWIFPLKSVRICSWMRVPSSGPLVIVICPLRKSWF